MNYYLLKQIVIYSRSRSKKNHQKTKQMSCFLISCHTRSERASECAWSVGCLSLGGRCFVSLLVLTEYINWASRTHRVQEIGEKYRVSMDKKVQSFSLCKYHPLRRSDCFSLLVRPRSVVKFFKCIRVSKLKCTASPYPPPSMESKGWSFCDLLAI